MRLTLLLACVLFIAPFMAAQMQPLAVPFGVNTTTTGVQTFGHSARCVSMDAAGNFVVVWASNGQDGAGMGVYARLFSATGSPLSGEIQVNTTTANNQDLPAVSMNSSGAFVVVWRSNGQVGGSGDDVVAQRFDAAGTKVGGEINVNQTVVLAQSRPHVSLTDGGEWVVVWDGPGTANTDIFARFYDAFGSAITPEIEVNGTTTGNQRQPLVACDSAGNATIVWSSFESVSWAVRARRLSPAGTFLTGEVAVDSVAATDQDRAAIRGEADGSSVVAWDDSASGHVFARRLDAALSPVGAAVQVSDTVGTAAAVARDASGGLTFAWAATSGGTNVRARQFTANLIPRGASIVVNTQVPNSSPHPAIAGGVNTVMVWIGVDAELQGIYARVYEEVPPPPPSILYVNAAWSAVTPGSDPDGAGPATSMGIDAFSTIQAAVDAATPGLTIQVAAGTYDEAVNINKTLILRGANTGLHGAAARGAESTVARGAGSAQVLFNVSAANVVIDGFQFVAVDTHAASCVAATTGTVGGLVVENCRLVRATGGLNIGFGQIYGIHVQAAGSPLVTIRANQIVGTEVAGTVVAAFYRGVWTYNAQGVIGGGSGEGNVIGAYVQDVLSQFASGAGTLIRGNTLLGAGVDISGPAAAVTVRENNFTPVVNAFPQSLMLKNVETGPVLVEDNTFSGHGNVGVFSGGSRNVTLAGNTFTPASDALNYSHVVVSSAYPAGSPPTPQSIPDNAITIRGNTFNHAGTGTGRALDFQHGLGTAGWGAITIGEAATENDFGGNLPQYIRLQTAGLQPPGNVDAGAAAFAENLDARHNRFGGVLPTAMNATQRADLEARVQHKVDDPVLGLVSFGFNYPPVLTAIQNFAGFEDTAVGITHSELLAASDATDIDSPALSFVITQMPSGVLLRNGLPAAVNDVIGPADSLSWTPDADANGALAAFRVAASDGNSLSAVATVSVDVTPVNDAPGFTASNPPPLLVNAGAQVINAWAQFSPGPANESGQNALAYVVNVQTNPGLFSIAPAVNAAGTLTFSIAAATTGSATFSVQARDDGGIANGGVDTSAPQLFTVTVYPQPTQVWVNAAWAATPAGTDPDGAGPAQIFGVDSFATLADAMAAAATGATIDVAAGNYVGATATKAVTIDGAGAATTRIRGASPALTVNSAGVVVSNVTLEVDTPAVDDPTVLVLSGDLTLSDAVVIESAIFSQAAIRLTGGAVVFGAGVTLNRQGAGLLVDNQTAGALNLAAVTLRDNGAAFADNFAIEDAIQHRLDNATLGLATWVAGNVYVTQASGSIQRGMDAADAGQAVNVGPGTFDEAVNVNKSLILRGANAGVDAVTGTRGAETVLTRTAGSNQTLVTIAAADVQINGFELQVNRPFATAGVAAINPAPFAGAQVLNNRIVSIGTGGSFANPFLGTSSAGIAMVGSGTPYENVTITGNDLTGSGSAFARAIWLREVAATVQATRMVATTQDLLIQFASGPSTLVQGNTFTGAGMDITEPNATTITIDQNTFQPLSPAAPQSLLIKHNYGAAAQVVVSANAFVDHTIAVVVAASRNVMLTGNSFANAASVADYTHVLFSTSFPTGGTPIAMPACGMTLRGNQFNHAAGPTAGRALDFQNGNSLSAIGVIDLGAAGLENQFDGNLPQYIRLQNVPLTGPFFAPASNPNAAAFALDLDAQHNQFDGVLPGVMNAAQRAALEARVFHKVDDPAVGLLTFGFNYTPTLTSVQDFAGIEDQPVAITYAALLAASDAADVDSSIINFTVESLLAGSLQLNGSPAILPALVTSADTLSWQAPLNANGLLAAFTVTATDGVSSSSPAVTVNANLTPVNDAPDFTASNPAAVLEDAGPQALANWAMFSPGPANEAAQGVLAYLVTNVSNPALFSAGPSVSTSGTLSFTAAPDANGVCTFDVQVRDDGGTLNGGVDLSAIKPFTITITPVNDAPSFIASSPAAVLEDAGPQSLAGWAQFIAGPANEAAQTVMAYSVTNLSNPALFAAGPSVSTNGTLSFTPAPNANGVCTFDVTVRDDGGTADGGVDTSAPQQFTVTVTAVNDPPTFTGGGNPPTIVQNAGPQVVAAWASAMSAGPSDEATQQLTFQVVPSGSLVFATAPAVSAAAGDLTYTAANGSFGTANLEIRLRDDGGTANGGSDTSAPVIITITVLPTPLEVWVDGTFSGLNYGDDPPGPATFFGIDAFVTVQQGVNAVATGGTVHVAAGTYAAAGIGKNLTVDATAATTLRGLTVTAGAVTLRGATVDTDVDAHAVAISGGTLTLQGVTVVESALGDRAAVRLTAGALDLSTLGGNTLRLRGAGTLIDNGAGGAINAIGTVLQQDAVTYNTATLADNFAIEDRMLHAPDMPGRGFVRWHAGNVYVTALSASIQRGVNAATAGDTLHVQAGTYAETVMVDRAITLRGAQADADADLRVAAFVGGKASPAIESVLTAAASGPTAGNPGAQDLLRVTADDITVNGLVIDGNNPALGVSSMQLGGIEIHARRGITNVGVTDAIHPVHNLVVEHCVLQNFGQRAVSMFNDSGVTHGEIRANVIRNFGTHGVIMFQNAYLTVEDNTITAPDNTIAVHWQNFFSARPGNTQTLWTGNRVTTGINAFGLHVNMAYGSASPLQIESNTVNAVAAANGEAFGWGINVWSIQGSAQVTLAGNVVGSSGGRFSRGINLWHLPTTSTVSVTGGTVGRAEAGLQLDNVDLQFLAAQDTHVQVSGLTVASTCTVGVLVRAATVNTWDSVSQTLSIPTPAGGDVSMALDACTIAASGTALRVETDSSFTADATLTGGTLTAPVAVLARGAATTAGLSGAAVTATTTGLDAEGGGVAFTVGTINAPAGVRLRAGGELNAFTNNFLTGNSVAGIRIEADAGPVAPVTDNSFAAPGAGIVNLSATQVDARNNWWGATRGPTEGTNVGGNGVTINSLSAVNYTPWWASGADNSPAAGFQGGSTVGSLSGQPRHAIPTEFAWTAQPATAQLAGVAITPAMAVRAQDAQGNPGINFAGQVLTGFVSNPVGANLNGVLAVAANGSASFPALTISLGGVFTLQAQATGPLGTMLTPVSNPVVVNNAVPVLSSVTPDWVHQGSGNQLLTLTGSGFTTQSQALWAGTPRTTLYNSANSLVMVIPASDLVTSGSRNITVSNPTPGGGVSSAIPFTINGLPTAVTLTGNSVAENQPVGTVVGTLGAVDPFPLTDSHAYSLVFGAGAQDNALFSINGSQLRTAVSFDFEQQPTRSVRVRATDQFGAWVENAFVINIVDVNEAPIGVADTYAAIEDTPLSVAAAQGVLANDTDPEGQPLTAQLVTPPSPTPASFTLNPNGSFNLTPALNYNGVITFVYRASDGTLASANTTVTINVASVNDAPVAGNDSYNTPEDTPLNVAAPGVLANDSDLHAGAPGENNVPLTAQLVTGTSNGVLQLNANGSFTYTPNLNYFGPDSFTYRCLDSLGAPSNIATVTLTVAAVDDAPELRAPLSGSAFARIGPTTFRLTLDPGPLPANAVLELADVDNLTVNVTVAPPVVLPAGITAPASNPTAAVGSLLSFTGNCGPADPLFSPYLFTVTLAAAPSPYTLEVVINDTVPEHGAAGGFGSGTAVDPYTAQVGFGTAPIIVVASVFDRNTSQTLTLTGSALIGPAGSPFSVAYNGSGNSGAIVLQASRVLQLTDVGDHDFSVDLTDGQNPVTLFVRARVLNTGNVPPTAGLAPGSVFTQTAPLQFELAVDPGQTLADAALLLSDADGNVLTLSSVTATPTGLPGVTAPTPQATALSPLRIEFTGTTDPTAVPGTYTYEIVVTDNITPPVQVQVRLILRDLPPVAVAGPDVDPDAPGTGTQADPYRRTVAFGHRPSLGMALIADPNLSQVLTLQGVNAQTGALLAFDFKLVSATGGTMFVIEPLNPDSFVDIGTWDIEAQVSDGGANIVSIYCELTITLPPPDSGGGGGGGGDGGCVAGAGVGLFWAAPLLLGWLWRRRRA